MHIHNKEACLNTRVGGWDVARYLPLAGRKNVHTMNKFKGQDP